MNQLVRSPQVGTRDGGWVWDGQRWVCCPDTDIDPCPPFIPPGFPPVVSPPLGQPPWYPGANGGVSFSSVAPPNPVRGHFWWNGTILQMWDGAAWVTVGGSGAAGGGGGTGAGTVVISATAPGNPLVGSQWWDGSQLRMWDGTQWKVIGPGQAVGPVPTTTQTFKLTQGGNLTIPINTWTVIPFTATPQVDTELAWNATTKQLTPKKGGLYLFDVRGLGAGAGTFGLILARNDTGTVDIQGGATDTIAEQFGAGAAVSTMGIAVMNGTTDFVRLFAYASDGTIYQISEPMFQAYLLP